MKLQIHYKEFYKMIHCPKNTIFLGLKLKGMCINSGMHLFFDNIGCTTHKETLPDGTKIKFYFYTSDDKELQTIMKDMKNIPHFLFTQDYLTITSINE